jgi:hypothetical protein
MPSGTPTAAADGTVIHGRTLAAMARRMVITRWLPTAYDVVIAVPVAVATARSNDRYDPFIGLMMAAALLGRRRRPATVMVTVSGLALVQYLLVALPARPLARSPTGRRRLTTWRCSSRWSPWSVTPTTSGRRTPPAAWR